jgi:hypothetical protein
MVGIVTAEQTANIAHIQPSAQIYYEINCTDRMLRELSITVRTSGGATEGKHTPSNWRDVPPEGNAATLLKLLCRPQ